MIDLMKPHISCLTDNANWLEIPGDGTKERQGVLVQGGLCLQVIFLGDFLQKWLLMLCFPFSINAIADLIFCRSRKAAFEFMKFIGTYSQEEMDKVGIKK